MSDNLNTIATKYYLLKNRTEGIVNKEIISLFDPSFVKKVGGALDRHCALSDILCKRKLCKFVGISAKYNGLISVMIEAGAFPNYYIINGDIIKMNSDFKNYQAYCFKKLEPLILSRVAKYRKFDNYEDLKQDAYMSLFLALESFNPERGSFLWWVNYYINTIVSRAANTHSTIRIPIKKAKEMKPHKESEIPILIDKELNPLAIFNNSEMREKVINIVHSLPDQHQNVMRLLIGLNSDGKNADGISITDINEKLNISTSQYRRIIRECKRVFMPFIKDIRSSITI